MPLERLQKILAQAGLASRRAAERYIVEGRVRVNGKVVTELGSKADPDADTIEVEGVGALQREPLVYLMMYKPPHVVTTVKDPEGRQTVLDVLELSRAEGRRRFEGAMPRVYPVGRLDFDAEGILLLTNDGGLANDLLHPRYHVPKTYVVKLRGRPEDRQLARLRAGVRLKELDGRMSRATAPAEVTVLRESPSNTWIELTIIEGRHHQVKRMCEAIGHQVIRLIRTTFGGLELGDLPAGAWRFLSDAEVASLRGWRTDTRRPQRGGGKPTGRVTPGAEPRRSQHGPGPRKSQHRPDPRKSQRGPEPRRSQHGPDPRKSQHRPDPRKSPHGPEARGPQRRPDKAPARASGEARGRPSPPKKRGGAGPKRGPSKRGAPAR